VVALLRKGPYGDGAKKVAEFVKDTGLKQDTSTDAAGAFLFSTLPVGNYQLHVEKPDLLQIGPDDGE